MRFGGGGLQSAPSAKNLPGSRGLPLLQHDPAREEGGARLAGIELGRLPKGGGGLFEPAQPLQGDPAIVLIGGVLRLQAQDRKSTRLNSSHLVISYAVFCLKKKNSPRHRQRTPPPRGPS